MLLHGRSAFECCSVAAIEAFNWQEVRWSSVRLTSGVCRHQQSVKATEAADQLPHLVV